jgi:hypothetical protein
MKTKTAKTRGENSHHKLDEDQYSLENKEKELS